MRKLLVVLQVALSFALLIGTGLFLRSLGNLKSRELGFDRQVLLVWTFPGQTGGSGTELVTLWDRVQDRISSISGVVSASASVEGLLPGGPTGGPLLRAEGSTAPNTEDDRVRGTMTVGPRFFQTIGQPMLAGREFTSRDSDSAPNVTIVNQSLARHFFGNQDAVGKRLMIGTGRNALVMGIVGVVKDAKQTPRETGGMMLYYPPGQNMRRLSRSMCLAIRVTGDPLSMGTRIRQELRAIDPRLPVVRIETVEEQLDRVLFQERMIAALLGFFGLLAVLLASIGLYGVISYMVARRINEFGVRLALGARRADVVGLVFKNSLLLAFAGVVIGLPVALGTGRLISTMLYGVTASDPWTLAGAALLMIVVAGLAGFLPAYRASRVDPMVALHYE